MPGETWEEDASCDDNYAVGWAREFRYDGARQRYLVRELDADDLENGTLTAVSTVWTDYDGDEPYGDYSVAIVGDDPPLAFAFESASIELGISIVDPWADEDGDDTLYFHGNHLGTTRMMSDPTGSSGVSPAVYTAFGERVSGTNHRYGYAGAWGYQSHSSFDFLHVGHRYYDPASGRLLQRDPIGIAGGLNVYAYVYSRPTEGIDPSGTTWWKPELNTGRIRFGPSRPQGMPPDVRRLLFDGVQKVFICGVRGQWQHSVAHARFPREWAMGRVGQLIMGSRRLPASRCRTI